MAPQQKTSPWVLAGVAVGAAIAAGFAFFFVADRPDRAALPECENSIGMQFVCIPAGTFVMGSPTSETDRQDDEGQHDVEITHAFSLGKYEVTQGQFERVMGFNPSAIEGASRVARSEHPVENVSWGEAVEFCRRLSEQPEEKALGRTYRLPTEAEWEYACRAGEAGQTYSLGHTLDGHANISYHHECDSPPTRRVGCYPSNAWGLHDMHGNVWEWCQDRYSADYYSKCPVQDPRGPDTGEKRVLRGGSRASLAGDCRSANRIALSPEIRLGNGFRVVMVQREVP